MRGLAVLLCVACGTSSPGKGSGGTCTRPYFKSDAPWNQPITSAPKSGESDTVIAHLQSTGWGLGHMQIDFSINVICEDDAASEERTFTETGDWYDPDCDPGPVPVPPGGHVEGETGYSCTQDGDCHLIVVDPKAGMDWEQWRVDITGGTFNGGCLAVWNMAKTVPPEGRGERCTSADAGGFPMAALLFDADEVASDSIHHAIRFILPNDRIRQHIYVHPATHATDSSGGSDSPPYGARLRLDPNFDMTRLPNKYAVAVAHAMQTYGMILSDGGNVALTAENDEHSTAKWDFDTSDRTMATGLGPRDLDQIQPSDFVMVEGGTEYDVSADPGCVRSTNYP
jgi:serine/threonine-protein kinase